MGFDGVWGGFWFWWSFDFDFLLWILGGFWFFAMNFWWGGFRLVGLWLDFGFRLVGLWILDSDWLVWWWCGGGVMGGVWSSWVMWVCCCYVHLCSLCWFDLKWFLVVGGMTMFAQRRWVVWLGSWTVVVVVVGGREREREIKIRERSENNFILFLFYFVLF